MAKKYGLSVKIAVALIYLVQLDIGLVASALAYIQKAFPEAGPTSISMILSLPMIFVIIANLISGKLSYYFSKRNILLIALAIFIFGGVGGAFINGSIFQILVLRVIVGIGGGLAVPLCGAYITELWEGDERVAMMGYANGGASLITIALTMAAGVLCMIRWEYTFLAYAVFIPILILEYFALPGTPPERLSRPEKSQAGQKEEISRPVWMLTLCSLILMLTAFFIMIKLPILIMDRGIGDAKVTSLAMSLMAAANIVCSLVFSQIYKIVKRYTGVVAVLFLFIGYYLIMKADTAAMSFVAMFLFGTGMGIWVPFLLTKASMHAGPTNKAQVMSIVSTSILLSSFLAGFSEAVITAVTGITLLTTMLGIMVTLMGLYFVISLVWTITHPETKPCQVDLHEGLSQGK
jgi:MFS family permease